LRNVEICYKAKLEIWMHGNDAFSNFIDERIVLLRRLCSAILIDILEIEIIIAEVRAIMNTQLNAVSKGRIRGDDRDDGLGNDACHVGMAKSWLPTRRRAVGRGTDRRHLILTVTQWEESGIVAIIVRVRVHGRLEPSPQSVAEAQV